MNIPEDIREYIWSTPEKEFSPTKFGKQIEEEGIEPETTFHEEGRSAHPVKCYSVSLWPHKITGEPEVIVRWGYCSRCAKLRFHEVYGLDNKKNVSYTRTFIKGGEKEYADEVDSVYNRAKEVFTP